MKLLNAYHGRITDGAASVHLKGVNLGGWFMPEAYFTHAPNQGVSLFRKRFVKACGEAAFRDLEGSFRRTFITREDLKDVRRSGFNCVRLPFHYALIERKPYVYDKNGLGYLDRAVRWAKENDLFVILDMHAVPGAQNHDWHSDSDGRARFWGSSVYQNRACALWALLADRYKDEAAVAGYDVLNEAVVGDSYLLNKYYHAVIRAIRQSDKAHIIFLEGNRWAQDLACLDDFNDDNLVFSFHFYEPLEFTFNFVPGLRYPLKGKGRGWGRDVMRERVAFYASQAAGCRRALYCGEFGVNARGGLYGEAAYLKDLLAEFRRHDIHWTYWTWKAVKNSIFPDGIYSYVPNDPWVNRSGPLYGWETWHLYWKSRKKEMVESWRTRKFTQNSDILNVLCFGLA